jgi:ParB/RepB/Spo0J family partition protein
MSNHDVLISPKDIIINRETRQRQENIKDVEDLVQSIAKVGIINPIVVRTTDEGYVLIAGERRLRASLQLGLTYVPVRFLDHLTAEESEVIELEENVKRKELTWRDQVKSVGRIHALYKAKDTNWRIEQTSEAISLHHSHVRKILHVYEALESSRIAKADSIEQAYNTLHRFAERKAEAIVNDLITTGTAMFADMDLGDNIDDTKTITATKATIATTEATTTDFTIANAIKIVDDDLPKTEIIATIATKPPTIRPDTIICANFADWASAYNGPKFTLIHCDFPYGNYKGDSSKGAMSVLDTEDFYDNKEEVYWNLLNILTTNLDKIMSYSAHMVFWFNMNFYTETVKRLRQCGLMVHDHPLIWHKTGGPGGLGVTPGTAATHPRRTYDTALMAVRGNRPLVRSMCNSYASPTVGNKIHPAQKPEPMLRYFLQMFVDETSSVLDPTCGSGAALRVAEDLGAKSILGLELDPNYAKSALLKTTQARVLRQAGQNNREV